MRRINTFHVEGRISLGITQRLRFSKHVFKRPALVTHFSQDEVAGAVDDAGDPVDAIGRQTFTQRLDDRNTTGDRGLERNHHALGAGSSEDLVAVHGNQRLVGGDHVLAIFDRLEHHILGQRVTADQFDNDVDLGVIDQFEDVVGYRCHTQAAGRVRVPGCNLGDLNATPSTPGNFRRVALQNIEGATADGAQSTNTYFDRFQTLVPTWLLVDYMKTRWRGARQRGNY